MWWSAIGIRSVRGKEIGMRPSYVHGASSTPLLGQTIGENLDRAVARHGDREALVSCHQGLRYTYAELGEAVDCLARGLLATGMAPGDRLGIWSPNRAEWVLVQYASAKAGIILVNVNPAYRTSDHAAMIEDVRGGLPELEQVVLFDSPEWEALATSDADAELPPCQFDDAINIQYTSGTTGFPKGATLSHSNILNNGYFVAEGCRYTEEDRVCIPVPFYHCFGMVMGNLGCTTHGACMVIPEAAFDPEATLRAVQDERCTSLYGVPTMFIAELEHPRFGEFDLSSLRTGIVAGAPCPVEVMKQIQSRM